MSKVKLIVVKSNRGLMEGGTDSVIDTGITVPDTHRILTVVRSDFDEEEDGSRRADEDLAPVIDTDGINYLVGKLLTLNDAAFPDPEQRKAMKDLVTQTVWGWYEGQLEEPRHTWRRDKGYEK